MITTGKRAYIPRIASNLHTRHCTIDLLVLVLIIPSCLPSLYERQIRIAFIESLTLLDDRKVCHVDYAWSICYHVWTVLERYA